MKYFLILLVFYFGINIQCEGQTYYVAFNPLDCSNCYKGIEIGTKIKNSIYFFQKQYQIDSPDLKKRYLFSKNAKIIFSDSLFNKYAINGRSSISNKNATLKCSPSYFTEEANAFFKKILSQDTKTDTIAFNDPISKMSISKYQFTNDGKVYLLNAFDNSIVLYDLFNDRKLYTIRMDENTLKNIYRKFSLGDTTAYTYYKKGTARFTHEDLSIVKDMSLSNDSLYVACSNYYFYIGGKDGTDTFYSHFESISVYVDSQCVISYVPSTIKDKLLNNATPFTTIPKGIYAYNNDIYTSIYNGKYYTGKDKYIIGRFSLENKKVSNILKLNNKFNLDYNFTNPYYSDRFLILSKFSRIYNILTGNFINADYFQQSYLKNQMVPNYPKYLNCDFKVDNSYFNILYYTTSPEIAIYYVRIDRKTQKMIFKKQLPPDFKNMKIMINPYNFNSVFGFYGNNKLVVYNVFK